MIKLTKIEEDGEKYPLWFNPSRIIMMQSFKDNTTGVYVEHDNTLFTYIVEETPEVIDELITQDKYK